jgi:hypothetical protein
VPAHFGQVFNHAAVAIFPHLPDPGFPVSWALKLFPPFNALPVNIGETNQVGRHMPAG